MTERSYQFAIIGGGFFGCAIALYLRSKGFERIAVVERERSLLARASYCNQARVHQRLPLPAQLSHCVSKSCEPAALRARLRLRSEVRLHDAVRDCGPPIKVVPRQFERFMQDIGAAYESVGPGYRSLFDLTRIAAVYVTEEHAFDALRLREYFMSELAKAGVDVLLGTECVRTVPSADGPHVDVHVTNGSEQLRLSAGTVFNCTYARLNRTVTQTGELTPLKHEVTEVALVEPPGQLDGLGVTVMDGPFFSCMPFPSEQCYSLTHVRYTPHGHFTDSDGSADPLSQLDGYNRRSHVHYMMADAARYMPCMRDASWRRSLFDIKTVLVRNESDDGRPVLLRRESIHPQVYSILGAKIDNVYDVLERLDAVLPAATRAQLASIQEAV